MGGIADLVNEQTQEQPEPQDEALDIIAAFNEVTTTLESAKKFVQETNDEAEENRAADRLARTELKEAVQRVESSIQAVDPETVKKKVNRIEEQFSENIQKTVTDAGERMDRKLESLQKKVKNPVNWVGHLDLKEFLENAVSLYLAGLLAIVATAATVITVLIGVPKLWEWASTTEWLAIFCAIALAVPVVLSLVAVTILLLQYISDK